MAAPDLLVLDEGDNVGTALRDLERGTAARVSGADGGLGTLLLASAIRLGHKVALARIEPGSMVVKHGHPIGRATVDIGAGEHVHVHNVVSLSKDDTIASEAGT
jgi:hypothetical protein